MSLLVSQTQREKAAAGLFLSVMCHRNLEKNPESVRQNSLKTLPGLTRNEKKHLSKWSGDRDQSLALQHQCTMQIITINSFCFFVFFAICSRSKATDVLTFIPLFGIKIFTEPRWLECYDTSTKRDEGLSTFSSQGSNCHVHG